MDMDFVLIGQRVREARMLCGVSSQVLAKQVGLTPASLRHIENGTNKPSLQALYRIATVLEVSLDYLTGRTPVKPDSLTGKYRLSTAQEKIARELLDSIVPILTNHI